MSLHAGYSSRASNLAAESGSKRASAPTARTSIDIWRGDDVIGDDLFLPGRISAGDFNGWLRDAMAERRLSQRALAMRTGISHSTISRLITGDRIPSLSTAIAIVRVLGPRPWSVQPTPIGVRNRRAS
jgi:DNA-binding XRE family transcriptional regulator